MFYQSIRIGRDNKMVFSGHSAVLARGMLLRSQLVTMRCSAACGHAGCCKHPPLACGLLQATANAHEKQADDVDAGRATRSRPTCNLSAVGGGGRRGGAAPSRRRRDARVRRGDVAGSRGKDGSNPGLEGDGGDLP
jgi:hypothetical protein